MRLRRSLEKRQRECEFQKGCELTCSRACLSLPVPVPARGEQQTARREAVHVAERTLEEVSAPQADGLKQVEPVRQRDAPFDVHVARVVHQKASGDAARGVQHVRVASR